MSKSSWLNTTEYLFIAAAAAGTIATAVAKAPVYTAAAPLTVAVALNAINRQGKAEKVKNELVEQIKNTERQISNRIESIDDRFQALPPPPEPVDLSAVEEKINSDRASISQLQQQISRVSELESLLKEVQDSISSVQKHSRENAEAIEQSKQQLQSLPTRAEVESISRDTLGTIQATEQTNQETLSQLRGEVGELSSRMANLAAKTESIDLGTIEQNISTLSEQLSNLHAQTRYDARLDEGEIESLSTRIESGISRVELNLLAEDLERVKQQKQQLEKTIEQLQKAFKQLPPPEEIERMKQKLDRVDTREMMEISQSYIPTESPDLQEIEGEIADLKTQISEMQKQLVNRQHSFSELDSEQKQNTDSPRLKKILTWFNEKF